MRAIEAARDEVDIYGHEIRRRGLGSVLDFGAAGLAHIRSIYMEPEIGKAEENG